MRGCEKNYFLECFLKKFQMTSLASMSLLILPTMLARKY